LLGEYCGAGGQWILVWHWAFCYVGTLSVIIITTSPSSVFRLSHNALTLLRSFIASIIYLPGHLGAVITFNSYCSELTEQRYCFHLWSLFRITSPSREEDKPVSALNNNWIGQRAQERAHDVPCERLAVMERVTT
jgi:hypothetical protein